jgi:carbon storage regulator CsrA
MVTHLMSINIQGGFMLVLTRKLYEKVYITTPDGKKIALTICGIQGYGKNGRVKIGIDADKNYVIAREELILSKNQEEEEEEEEMFFNKSLNS